jgi:diaminopimelate epimerase
MAEILNAHGSRNDIFVTALTPGDFAADSDLRAFVGSLCDRSGPFGGDGVYFYDAGRPVPEAWFFNPDGSAAEFCGNGMRCLGRVILDLRGTDAALIRSGGRDYTVRRGPTTAEGVHQVRLEHPAVDFDPAHPVVVGHQPAVEASLPELDPRLTFTAVAIPNPHLVAVIDTYSESDLVAMGQRVDARRDLFPAGANLSVLLPLAPAEIFVRTFERGAGLTASCGSGMAAARAAYSRIGRGDPEREVVIRNAGGMATASLRVRDGQWFPVLEGNATFVYRADVDPARVTRAPHRELFPEEIRAYDALDEQNSARLRAAGIETAVPSRLPRGYPRQRPARQRDHHADRGRAEQGEHHAAAQPQQQHGRPAEHRELPADAQRPGQRDGCAEDRADRGRPGPVQKRLRVPVRPQPGKPAPAGQHERERRRERDRRGQ